MGLLALVIVVPTASVLWFMTRAMQNEHLAVQQKLVAYHHNQLDTLGRQWQDAWAARLGELDGAAAGRPGPEAFFTAVDRGLADAVAVFDARGQRVYPEPLPVAPPPGEVDPSWRAAARLEMQDGDPTGAAKAYAAIASEATTPDRAARAWRTAARAMARAGDVNGAVDVLTDTLAADRFAEALDARGHLIVADAELRALELIADPASDRYRTAADRLTERLSDYGPPALPAAQRRFLSRELGRIDPDRPPVPLATAETLAARWVALGTTPPDGSLLQPSGLPGVWAARRGALVALFRTDSIEAVLRTLPAHSALPTDLDVRLLSPDDLPPTPDAVAHPAGDALPGWRLALSHDDPTLFNDSARRQNTAYLWTGLLAIASTLVLAALIARAVSRQTRATRLKNDLVATVSHELKTPLSSMRLLVDTLLDAEDLDDARVREYLQLIGRENTRLTRLIENFLSFSRLDQNRYAFHPEPLDPGAVVEAAAAAVRERFDAPDARLETEVAPDLPRVFGDHDALVTALVNLLDNAHKYTGDPKHVVLRATAEGDRVGFAVQDNGVGIARAATGRVFSRFYQAEPAASTAGGVGGVGLGLSIVQAVATAHGGTIDVDSEPGRGSTFTLRIPTPTAVTRKETPPDAR